MMRTSIRFGLLAASAVFALVLLATLPSQGAPAAQESPLSPLAAPAGEDALWTEYNAAVFDAAVYQSDHLRPLLPLVEDSATRCRYTPFDVEGLCFCTSAISASRFSLSALISKLALPIVQCTMPALSTR